MFSFPECVTRLAVGLTECVAIVTLNIITTSGTLSVEVPTSTTREKGCEDNKFIVNV